MALHRPPGLTRKRFGFQGWLDFDIGLWTSLRDEARSKVLKALPAIIRGYDIRKDAVEFSRTNARTAGIGSMVPFERLDLRHFAPPEGPPGTIICNPPYGERIGEEKDLPALYEAIGEMFKRCPGWSCFVFTGNDELARDIDLDIVEEWPFFNGKIPCRLLRY
jgi:putative N6-adenine-specific DNA methylase